MSDYRNSQAGNTISTAPSTGYHVPAPERTDGVGMALRRAFNPCRAAHDFADLLVELDRANRRVEG
ncbi:MAG TPA: hypothetical protein VL918_14045 [Sphingobium sp.]|nr:hypothetical protein [Sphingobium sp.]